MDRRPAFTLGAILRRRAVRSPGSAIRNAISERRRRKADVPPESNRSVTELNTDRGDKHYPQYRVLMKSC